MTSVNRSTAAMSQSCGAAHIFAVDGIERDADFGDVVEQVVQQDLSRRQREERDASDATAMDSMLPKFDDVPMRTYFMMLA